MSVCKQLLTLQAQAVSDVMLTPSLLFYYWLAIFIPSKVRCVFPEEICKEKVGSGTRLAPLHFNLSSPNMNIWPVADESKQVIVFCWISPLNI